MFFRFVQPHYTRARACVAAVALFASAMLGGSKSPGTSPALGTPHEAVATTNPATITALAAQAYLWGLGPQYIQRSSQYNTIIGAPFNAFKYGVGPAAWNNEAVNAGNASVLYISGFVNFNQTSELVLTVPPSAKQYYVVAYYDAYANTIGSIGTRTTASETMTSYLLVGPNSPYAKKQSVNINGYDYPVLASDTNINWFIIRVLANTLIDASAPTSVPSVLDGVAHKFALNSLGDFETNGHNPVYPADFVLPQPTSEQVEKAGPYQNAPTEAIDFFSQLGTAVATNPIPHKNTALSGTSLSSLPTYVVPQYGAENTYLVPSYGQQEIFDSFAPLGLTAQGFQVPSTWGEAQKDALQAGYDIGQKILNGFIAAGAGGKANTDYWTILNDLVGTYPNTALGYLYRSTIVIAGGVANAPQDVVYPTLTGNPSTLDGNHTYKMTFTLPTPNAALPAKGVYPPMAVDSAGKTKGFWSVHVYATDKSQGSAPFIAQTSVLNTSYSKADTAVDSVDPSGCISVMPPNWGKLVASTPIIFGENASAYGLTPNQVYYVATAPKSRINKEGNLVYTFKISAQWLQPLSTDKVPIQGPTGTAGPIVPLTSPANPPALTYGMVKPVTQLGSPQLDAGQLVTNGDGSLTLWFGPALPPGAPVSNWIPTPSTDYYRTLYPTVAVGTSFQLTMRMYYPRSGSEPPSILPCSANVCGTQMNESYIPPVVELVQ